MKREEQYKPIEHGAGKEAMDELKSQIVAPLEKDIEKLRDPVVLAALMHTAATERENTNRLLRTLIEKMDAGFSALEKRISALESETAPRSLKHEEILLPLVDEEILRFVKDRGHVSAEEVRQKFGYKGKNAASARLNHLCDLGLLYKRQVGRVVMFGVNK